MGTLGAGQTTNLFITESNSLPNSFTVNVYVEPTNGSKLKSATITRSGTINFFVVNIKKGERK